MPSRMLAAKAVDESSIGMQFNQDKRSTALNQSSELSSEKPKLPRRIKNVDLFEKVGALKTEKLPRQPAKDREEVKKSLVASPLGATHKPWPSRQLKGFDDPVMNMSNVPLYLQCKGKGYNVHGRALNVGVLDWGLLEKWTHHQKDVGVRDSASSSIESSLFSDLSNQSCTTISSPISQGKQSPVIPCKKSPVSSSATKICETDDTKHLKGFHDSSISSKMLPSRHEDHLDADFGASADLLGQKPDKFIGTDLDVKTSNQEHLGQHSTTSFPIHKIDEATATRVVEDYSCSLRKEAKAIDRDNSLPLTSNMPFYMYCNKGMRDYLQGVGSECLNSGLDEDFEVISHYPQIPHSCPLPLAVLDDESDVASNHPSFCVAPTDQSVCENGKQHEINTTILESGESEAKAKASGGKQSFVHPLNAGPRRMSKSYSLREGSTEGRQHESVPLSYNSQGDQATKNNKSRQSPLRRILDPIMKPKNNPHLIGINAASNIQHSGELRMDKPPYVLHKPSNPNLNSTRQAREVVFNSNELPNDEGTQNEDRHAAQMKQALLQLAWKNGLPLFMLSSCDGEVLAAAITMRSTCNDDDLECVYRIFSVNGSQKKSTFWSNGASKAKKHHLVSNVVGQLNVSLAKLKSYEYGSSSDVRAFVLHDACKSVDSSTASELAAIVVGVTPTTKSDSSPMLNRSSNRGPLSTYSVGNISVSKDEEHLHIHQQNNGIGQTGISVIIPKGAHGLSIEGEPSTLIERWRTGACDCGGWDEGCPLSILGNKFQGSQTTDGTTHRFQLFTQGASEEKGHAFSMVSFKEGLCTVGFQSPISLLQAFAICIAILHDRKPNKHLSQRSLRAYIYNDQLARTQGGDPMSYLPNHPPLSPFGRA